MDVAQCEQIFDETPGDYMQELRLNTAASLSREARGRLSISPWNVVLKVFHISIPVFGMDMG